MADNPLFGHDSPMSHEHFRDVGFWVGGILAALVIEAVLARIAQRCMPGLFGPGQNQKPQLPARRR